MDRNSAIGLTLIAGLLFVYFYWFSPKPQPRTAEQQSAPTQVITPSDSAAAPQPSDSVLAATYGDLSQYVKGQETTLSVKTNDLTVSFTNRGGIIRELELNNFKTYYKEPLKLITPTTTSLKLLSTFKGRELDLYSLYYTADQQKSGDSTIVTYSLKLGDGSSLTQRYVIPDKGFEIKYSLQSSGFDKQLEGDNLSLVWNQIVMSTEKDIKDTRNYTTINYYTTGGDFDYLKERSTDTEKETVSSVKWISIKQKYFLSSIIADNEFKSADIETAVNVADTTVVKRANSTLSIAKSDLSSGKAEYKFYLGPNDYQVIGKVTDSFAKNVYLGWPPVYWVNKFVIFPVFHFLTLHLKNFGIIIIILVILMKLVLAPLSYRSYLSMAKMRVLKPELDEIKEKHGEDMTKVQQEQLKLYQQVGVNPVSGCIPVLLQLPIIFAMFYLFPNSIELRQQPLLWAEDLSTYDSLIKLPFTIPFAGNHISLFTVMMTVSTLIYTWQNNQLTSATGPMKSMSYIMPLIFFFMLNSFPTGLTFYYFVSNLATFAQQAIIKRFVHEDRIKGLLEENRKKIASGTGKKSKFMTKLQEAMKAGEAARKTAEDAKKKKKG